MKKILTSICVALIASFIIVEITSCKEVVDEHVHDIVEVKEKDATCTEDGNIAYYKCDSCDKFFSDSKGEKEIDKNSVVIASKGHSLLKVEAINSSCENAGSVEYYKCSVCNKLFSDSEGKNEISADEVVIPASHKLDKVDAVAASCESAGNIAYYKCSVCNKLFSDADGKNEISADDVVIPASHKLDKVDAVAASCESAGNIAYYKCSVCSKLFSDSEGKNEISADEVVIPASHKLDKVDAVAASCESSGNIAYYKCSVCNKLFSDAEGKNEISADEVVIPASHKLDKVDAVAASCESFGNIAYYKCSVCNKLFSDAEGKNEISADEVVIPASNHKLDKVDAVAASCESSGNIAYYKCSVCSKLFSDAEGKNEISADDVVIPASSHKYVVGEIVEPTASSAGSIAVNCSVCGASDSIVLPELIEDNYNNGFYDYRVEYTLKSRGVSTIMAVRKGIYIYNNDDLGIYKEFENPLSSSLSSSGGMADLSSGSYNGVFKATFLKRNLSLDSSSAGIGLKNITDGYYKFTITSPSSDIVATLISSTGVVEDIIVSVDDLSALLKLDSSVTYLIVIHSAADTSSDVEYTIEQAEIPTISDTEECNIGTLQGGNVAGGGQGGSIDVMVSESVAAGSYKLVLYGSTLIGRGSFNIIVNGETLSTTNGMNMVGGRNQISAACTITVNPGDMITIVSMNIQSISNIKVMLVAV